MPRIAALIMVAVGLVACASPVASLAPTPTPTCAQQAATFITTIQPLARTWDDAAQLAANTPRMALSPQVANLQSIRRETQDVQAPACAKEAHDRLIGTMDNTIQAYLNFLGQKPESVVAAGFEAANKDKAAYAAALAALMGVEVTPPAAFAPPSDNGSTPVTVPATPLPAPTPVVDLDAVLAAAGALPGEAVLGAETQTLPALYAKLQLPDDGRVAVWPLLRSDSDAGHITVLRYTDPALATEAFGWFETSLHAFAQTQGERTRTAGIGGIGDEARVYAAPEPNGTRLIFRRCNTAVDVFITGSVTQSAMTDYGRALDKHLRASVCS